MRSRGTQRSHRRGSRRLRPCGQTDRDAVSGSGEPPGRRSSDSVKAMRLDQRQRARLVRSSSTRLPMRARRRLRVRESDATDDEGPTRARIKRPAPRPCGASSSGTSRCRTGRRARLQQGLADDAVVRREREPRAALVERIGESEIREVGLFAVREGVGFVNSVVAIAGESCRSRGKRD
jgi:hypothetical protein